MFAFRNDSSATNGVPRGLYNLGNTCYMNAALQTLSNCPPIRDYFCLLNVEKNQKVNNDVSVAFRDLLNRLWLEYSRAPIKPINFLFVSFLSVCNDFQLFRCSTLEISVHSFAALVSKIHKNSYDASSTFYIKNWSIQLTMLLGPYLLHLPWALPAQLPTRIVMESTQLTVEWVQRM